MQWAATIVAKIGNRTQPSSTICLRKTSTMQWAATIVTDIGVSINDPQPVEKDLMTAVMTESMVTGETLPEWVPHEGHSVHGEAGGQMAL